MILITIMSLSRYIIIFSLYHATHGLSAKEDQVLSKIMKYYQPNVMPTDMRNFRKVDGKNDGQNLFIQFQTNFTFISYSNQKLDVQIKTSLKWYDERFHFEGKKVRPKIRVPPSFLIWTTSLSLDKFIRSKSESTSITVTQEGLTQTNSILFTELKCHQKSFQHPFGGAVCDLELSTEEGINLECEKSGFLECFHIEIGRFSSEYSISKIQVQPVFDHSTVKLVFNLCTNLLDSVVRIYTPSMIFVSLCLFTTVSNRKTVRSLINIGSEICLFLMWMSKNEANPKLDMLDIWLLACMIIICLIILESVLIRSTITLPDRSPASSPSCSNPEESKYIYFRRRSQTVHVSIQKLTTGATAILFLAFGIIYVGIAVHYAHL